MIHGLSGKNLCNIRTFEKMEGGMHEAFFYHTKHHGKVECILCPHNCTLAEGQVGICGVRANVSGKLQTLVYGQVSALHSDPIEKKPLYHFFPGENILSVGSYGCNFQCDFCQNHSISQCTPDDLIGVIRRKPEEIVREAENIPRNLGIAYTYNEPFTFYEFMFDCARLAHNKGLKNVIVSNGFVHSEPLEKLLPFIDAFNIDLKAFSNQFYKRQAKAELDPVLKTLESIARHEKHLEITFLAIPELNDDPQTFLKMVQWISENLGKTIPLHISRYFPAYRQSNPPTPLSTLENFYDIAGDYLDYVFLGNVSDPGRSVTKCPDCEGILIKRNGYKVKTTELLSGSTCLNCRKDTGIVC